MATVAPALPFPGVAPKPSSNWRQTNPPSGQLDRLEGTDDVVRPLVFEEAFVKARPEIPVIALVVFVAIKAPNAADDDETADSVVPKIAQEMPTEVRPGERAFEPDVIVDDYLR